jgi:hypothetical protein
MKHWLIFNRGGLRFGFELTAVHRVCSIAELRHLPIAARDVIGVIPDGQLIVPVLNTPLPSESLEAREGRIVVVHHGRESFGLQVTEVEGPRVMYECPIPTSYLEHPVPKGLRLDLLKACLNTEHRPLVYYPGVALTFSLDPGTLYRTRLR